jgi:transporter family protein
MLGGLVFLIQKRPEHLITNGRGLVYVSLAGLSAFLIDYFALKTYASGLSVTVGGPIIIGGSIAVATLIGFIIGDSITGFKILGLLLLVAGATILATVQQ